MFERELVARAQAGDERAFAQLVEPHRERMRARCLQMLRSEHDADDALQDALVRAWRGLPRFAGNSVAPWLARIATNAALDVIYRRRRSVPVAAATDPDAAEMPDAGGAPSPAVRVEQREQVTMAYAAASELLSSRQRAALVLSDALGYSAADAADALDTTRTSVYSALQRARRVVAEHDTTVAAIDDQRLRRDGERFARAMERDDVETMVAMVRAA